MDDLWKKKHVNVSFQDLPQDGDNEISTFSPLCETSVVRRRGSWCFLGFFIEKLFKIPNSKAADLHIFIFIYLSDCFGATCLSERLVWMPLWPPDPHTYMHNVMLVCLRFNTWSSLLCRCYSSATRRPDKKVFCTRTFNPSGLRQDKQLTQSQAPVFLQGAQPGDARDDGRTITLHHEGGSEQWRGLEWRLWEEDSCRIQPVKIH